MALPQYKRILSAIEFTLDQMRDGPKDKGSREKLDAYEQRVEAWYSSKHRFVLYAIKCIREVDEHRAKDYLYQLKRLRQEI